MVGVERVAQPEQKSQPQNRGSHAQAAAARETIVVPDVDKFPGHIPCDSASRSEIVVPLIQDDRLLGVLDVDSPKLNRFDDADRRGLQALAQLWFEASDVAYPTNKKRPPG